MESCQLPLGPAELHLKPESTQGHAAQPPSLMSAPLRLPRRYQLANKMLLCINDISKCAWKTRLCTFIGPLR